MLFHKQKAFWHQKGRKNSSLWIVRDSQESTGLPRCLSDKESICQGRRCGLSPWVGRSPREANGNPLQYSCLGNNMHREAWYSPQGCKAGHDWACTKESTNRTVEFSPTWSHTQHNIVFTFLISQWISENSGKNCHQFKGPPVGNSILIYFPDWFLSVMNPLQETSKTHLPKRQISLYIPTAEHLQRPLNYLQEHTGSGEYREVQSLF